MRDITYRRRLHAPDAAGRSQLSTQKGATMQSNTSARTRPTRGTTYFNQQATRPPRDHKDALTLALFLSLTAPTDEDAATSVEMAEAVAVGLSRATVERCKARALSKAHIAWASGSAAGPR